jgi:hypothetical protein
MRLHDNAISHIAKIIQLAILTGTDIVDNFRAIDFEIEDNTLILNQQYLHFFDENLEKMTQLLQQQQEEETQHSDD